MYVCYLILVERTFVYTWKVEIFALLLLFQGLYDLQCLWLNERNFILAQVLSVGGVTLRGVVKALRGCRGSKT